MGSWDSGFSVSVWISVIRSFVLYFLSDVSVSIPWGKIAWSIYPSDNLEGHIRERFILSGYPDFGLISHPLSSHYCRNSFCKCESHICPRIRRLGLLFWLYLQEVDMLL